MLAYYQGRFQSAQGKHRDAVLTLQDYLRRYSQGEYQYPARLYLGRSAYLTDQDGIALPALTLATEALDDAKTAAEAYSLLGTLHLDRDRPAEAVKAVRECARLRKGTGDEADALWRLGRALWEAKQMAEAAAVFQQLAELNDASDYASAGRYWSNRAAGEAGQSAESQAREDDLLARFPYSYYAVLSAAQAQPRAARTAALDSALARRSSGRTARIAASSPCLRRCASRTWRCVSGRWPAVNCRASTASPGGRHSTIFWQGNRSAAWLVILTDLGAYLRSEGPRPAEFIATAYPLHYEDDIRRLSAKYGIDPSFVFGLICQESHYNSGAISPVGAIGLMQLMPATARLEARKLGLRTSAGQAVRSGA